VTELPPIDWSGLEAAETVSLDTECSGLFADDGARVACVALAWEGGSLALPFDQGRLDKLSNGNQLERSLGEYNPNRSSFEWDLLCSVLREKRIVMHNAKYDLHMMAAGTRHFEGVDLSNQVIWDTMLASRVLEPRESAGLDACGARHGLGGKLGADEVAGWLKKNRLPKGRYDLVPWESVEPYVKADAELTYQLWRVQKGGEGAETSQDELSRQFDLCRTLFRIERRGIAYDGLESIKCAEAMLRKADEIEASMPFKCDITAAKKYFFETAGLPPDRVTDKGAPSLDREQVRDWVAAGIKWAEEYQIVSRARKAVSMWYQGYPDKMGADGRLRTSYNQGTVVSGRLSSERVNLQAVPKADKIQKGITPVRKLLRAKEGCGLWSLDMSQAELRVAAQYSGCTLMLERLADGVDFHALTTIDVLGVSPDDPDFKLKRDIGKQATFSSIFGIGGESFQKLLAKQGDVHLGLDECEQIVKAWRNTYPEIRWAYYKAQNRAERDGYVRILPGTEYERKSWLGPRDWPHTGWNRMVQGSLAAFVCMWLVAVDQDWPDTIVQTVHDSIVLELPVNEGDRIANEIAADGARRATEIFGLTMKVDVDRYI